MKTSHYRVLVGLMGFAAVVGLLGLVRSPAPAAPTRQSALEFIPDQSDIWDESSAGEPPLTPGAAIRIALAFMPGVRLPDETSGWQLDHITLQRMSFSGGRAEWVYLADFCAHPDAASQSKRPPVHFQVPVRFNGSIPETFIANIPKARRIIWWDYRIAGKISA
jgi:hypothetical protein